MWGVKKMGEAGVILTLLSKNPRFFYTLHTVLAAPYPLPALTIVLSSRGSGAGTGPPAIFVTALNLGGQTSKQVPHLIHFS